MKPYLNQGQYIEYNGNEEENEIYDNNENNHENLSDNENILIPRPSEWDPLYRKNSQISL